MRRIKAKGKQKVDGDAVVALDDGYQSTDLRIAFKGKPEAQWYLTQVAWFICVHIKVL